STFSDESRIRITDTSWPNSKTERSSSYWACESLKCLEREVNPANADPPSMAVPMSSVATVPASLVPSPIVFLLQPSDHQRSKWLHWHELQLQRERVAAVTVQFFPVFAQLQHSGYQGSFP